ncbi:MAG: hypothetical protein P1S60_14480 [Anaerolineae bacterium]|nr:hypothetical protein [Anaerolineae bacterium]
MLLESAQRFDHPPVWAVLERQLFDQLNASAEPLLEKYVRVDGSILWPPNPNFSSIDGLDDAYESFHNWPLFYSLGGAEKFLNISHFEWDSITEQFTHYDCGHGHPMVVKEYEQGYDWFHQGEGYLFFYMLGLADPQNAQHIDRARRFAGFYLNEDPQAPNYDPVHKLVRCAYNGSMGPAHRNFRTISWGYAPWKEFYGLPFQDVPGFTSLEALRNRELADRMGKVMEDRMAYGDVATNLAISGMVTHAYLLTGDGKYKQWVLDYVDAWIDRTTLNGGMIPDNVGLSGTIGETINGKWYGGYYGWTWPHGWLSLGAALTSAVENAMLLHPDNRYLDWLRSQMDALIAQGIEAEGTLHVPYKYGDPGNYEYKLWIENVLTADMGQSTHNAFNTLLWKDGWFEFQPMAPGFPTHLWSLSMEQQDLDRILKIRNYHKRDWERILPSKEKDQGGHEAAWLAYLAGKYPDFPEEILRFNISQVQQRLAFMETDQQDPRTYSDAYLQHRNPITLEGLCQLTVGAPLPVYNGGQLMAPLRYFDRDLKRPGLPENVGALVEKIGPEHVRVKLANLSSTQRREMTVQAGTYGEHQFTTVRQQDTVHAVNAQTFDLDLLPGTVMTLDIALKRFVHPPSLYSREL